MVFFPKISFIRTEIIFPDTFTTQMPVCSVLIETSKPILRYFQWVEVDPRSGWFGGLAATFRRIL